MREKLLSITKKDLKIDYFSGTGAGGQHRNKHQNCVRIQHPASGAIATGQSSKSRVDNIRAALTGITEHPKFKLWLAGVAAQISTGKSIEDLVDEAMAAENLRVDYNEDGKWVPVE